MVALSKHQFFDVMALVAIFWTPHFLLDYVYRIGLNNVTAYGAQYLFFFLNLVGTLFLINLIDTRRFKVFFDDKWLRISLLLFIVGVVVSTQSMWNTRLFLIWVTITVGPVVAAIYVFSQPASKQLQSILILVAPILFPILFGLAIEIVGLANQGFAWLDRDGNGRWQYLHSSANGYGFDAAIVGLISACFIKFYHWKTIIPAVTGLVLGTIVLYFTQTRAAMLLMFVGFAVLYLLFLSKQQRLIVSAATLLVVPLFFVFFDIADLKVYFRIEDSMGLTTSGRSSAMVAALSVFGESPIIGSGFGSADKSMPFNPTNLFYFLIPVEIGLLGALGVLGTLTSCLSPLIRQALTKNAWEHLNQANLLASLSLVAYFAILASMVAEFSIFRISATNQIFFFFWSVNFLFFREGWLEHK